MVDASLPSLTAIALDDEPLALEVLRALAGRVPGLDLKATFTRPSEALSFLQAHPVDLVFLDINMPTVSGLEFCRMLPGEQMVVFTTAHPEFAAEGFELEAVDYLLKPIAQERFARAVQKARQYQAYRQAPPSTPTPDYLFVKADLMLHRLALTDIELVEGLDNYVRLHLTGRRPLLVRSTLKGLQEKLPAADFVRVHKSFIVPLALLEAASPRSLRVAGRDVPIGESYAADVKKTIEGLF